MFENLVESGSHKQDLSRKSSFILGTVAIYAVLGLVFIIGSIWFTVAQLDPGGLELTAVIAAVPVPAAAQPEKKQEEAKPQKQEANVDVRKELVARVDMNIIPPKVSAKASEVPPVRNNVTTITGSSNVNATAPMPSSTGPGTTVVAATKVDMPDPPPPEPKPAPPRAPISGGVLNGKAVHLVQPPYPQIAKQAHASGTVVVQVLIDENG